MLSDLTQYFTAKDEDMDNYEDYDFVEYIKFVHRYTHDEDIRNHFEESVIFNDIGYFIDIFEYGFNESMFMNDNHLGDAFSLSYSNNLLTTLLSTVMHTSAFEVVFEDVGIDMLCYDDMNIGLEYNINNFGQFSFHRKIDKSINKFIRKTIEDDFCDSDGCIDEYNAETYRFIASHIQFKNKSIGRKMRKAYSQDERVRNMFHELNYYMMNGELIFIEMYNIESVGYGSFFDMDEIYNGLFTLRHHWFHDDFINDRSRSFDTHIKKLNHELYKHNEYNSVSYSANYNRLMFSIMNAHKCDRKEVIL